ncbi:MAG TPA: c-type cytochrome [Actinomycetota bacterium]|nr:c-type cytochrome [Actinomycetota bacterium]
MSTSDVLLITAVVLVPAILLWMVFLARTGRPGKPRVVIGIPQALRPGQPDEVLEGPRLERLQVGWFLSILVTAAFIPIYWLPESQRQEAYVERFDEEALHRGRLAFQVPPELAEEADPAEFKELEEGIALGQGCAQCHGGVVEDNPETEENESANSASGGFAQPCVVCPVDNEGNTVVDYTAPPLNNVFTRWDEEVIRFTIERGRPGTPMPAWGVAFGGSMTPLMVSDVILWLKSLPGNQGPPPALSEQCDPPEEEAAAGATPTPGPSPSPQPLPAQCGQEIFEARCMVCHGPQGQGKEAGLGTEDQKTIWYQGMALWKGDVRHLTEELHFQTISNGRRFAFMPAFAEAPAQGIPVPLYPLTEEQIRAVMEYERSL